ncbi:metal-dependent hydrolase family protein [Sinorhizobium terangae]|uniref:metal-dependent hydrolase family protein n=1 Tax=Sinorhizobium terangae TaxID=110322 RepID=UPI0024B0FF9A|nr:amidohydrolase family protein [Sinorhizobium terangae]WFU46161.1 amidohydrolase family protein [Sinorhizobium terangae]
MFDCSAATTAPPDHIGCLCHRPEIRYIAERVKLGFSRRTFMTGVAAMVTGVGLGTTASAQLQSPPPAPARPILFTNIRLFDGTSPTLREGVKVLVEGNRIKSVEDGGAPAEALTIDGAGGVLMPGLIDAHTHLAFSTIPLAVALTADPSYLALRSARAAGDFLMQGFTTARDVGGPVFALKRAIDDGTIVGPRIWPAGAMISQTSGHGDFRTVHDLPREDGDRLHFSERSGAAAIADGVDEVLRRTREQLFQGASQIKVMAGGGVTSDHDPLDSTQYTEAELRAAVEAAAGWNTYVTVHAYTPKAIRLAIAAGVKCIEHGHLADEDSARLMAEKSIWWSLQPFLDDEDAAPFPEGSPQRFSQMQVISGTDTAFELAKKHGVKTAFGTDTLFSERIAARQGAQLAKLIRWHAPAEVLKMATADNAELLALSGPRSPYTGKLGVIEADALADLLLVGGDPLADISLIADRNNLKVIMKDGRIYKNTL